MTFIKLGSLAIISVLTMAACDDYGAPVSTVSAADGMTYNEMRSEYDGLSAVEFSIIDTNNDNLVDADEEGGIGITIGD